MAAKRFKFRLEPLLKLRQHREKERQKEHAASVHEASMQKEQLQSLDHQRLSTLDQQRGRLVGSLSVTQALVASRYLMQLKRQRLAGTSLLNALEREVEKKRLKLVEAARDRKTYEHLKEKQQSRHRHEAEKRDQKELDEIAVTSYRRHKRTG
ncbi:MAG: flagellar export protein FliJ [candidate division Zixibacteria bacterium]|nr:flagellar export protein FliJ [candidate division Zixibacteria bacterium]